MDHRSTTTEAVYAGWTKARLDLLRAAAEPAFALHAEARVDGEAWRASVVGETALWRALREAEAPGVPARFAAVHRRGEAVLDHLTAEGDGLRAAVRRADVELLVRSMERMDEAERSARSYFAAAYRLLDPPEPGG